jgi:hypothetical protein
MATTAGHRLTLDSMGKCSNSFFSETTNMIKAKLYMNVHYLGTTTTLLLAHSSTTFPTIDHNDL